MTNFSSSGNYSPILRLMGIGGLVLIDFGIGRLIKRIRLKIWSNLISHPPRGGVLDTVVRCHIERNLLPDPDPAPSFRPPVQRSTVGSPRIGFPISGAYSLSEHAEHAATRVIATERSHVVTMTPIKGSGLWARRFNDARAFVR